MKHERMRVCAGLLAAAATLICAGMAAVSAFERAATPTGRAFITALAVLLVLALHLLPALARRNWLAWPLWAGALVATLYGHAHFFAAQEQLLSENRRQAVAESGHTRALRAELAGLAGARALAVVAAELARAQAKAAQATAALQRCQAGAQPCTAAVATASATTAAASALGLEQGQAQRADELRRQLGQAAAQQDEQRTAAAADPVDRALGALLGWSAATVALCMTALQSLLAELIGALLWAVALGKREPAGAAPALATASAASTLPTAACAVEAASAAVGNAVAGVAKLPQKGEQTQSPAHAVRDPPSRRGFPQKRGKPPAETFIPPAENFTPN